MKRWEVFEETQRARKRGKSQSGQGLVEFAFAVPIFFMFVFGIVDISRVLFSYVQVSNASRQAVRYGIVEGLEAASHRYLDCTGIRDAALEIPGLVPLTTDDIDVYYEDRAGNKITDCIAGLSVLDVNEGDVLVVNINAEVPVLTPVLLAFTDKFSFYYTARRTIVSGIASTDDWSSTIPPDTAANFQANEDCTTGVVNFQWDGMDPIPARAEIRDAITGQVVVEIDDTEPGLISLAYCTGCDTISTNDGFRMYYLVAFNGEYPDEISGHPSNTDYAQCTYTPGPSEIPAITGYVFDDKDGDGVDAGASEQGIEGVRVYVFSQGADGILGNDDDGMHSQLTDADGNFAFYNLAADQNYRIDVGESSPPIRGDVLTTANDPFEASLIADITGDGTPELCGPGADGIPNNGDEDCTAGLDGVVGTADDDIVTAIIVGFDDP
jgi:hypothetical protein